MDHLPLEVHLKISSYLTLNKLAECRLVSHSFKLWAETNMQHITHLKLCDSWLNNVVKYDLRSWDEAVEQQMKESYVQHTFFSKPFVTALVKSRKCLRQAGSRFYAFLGKFCPNLLVLQMDNFYFTCKNLLLIGSKLQFFTCDGFSDERSIHIPPFSLEQFPNLKGFTYSRVIHTECINSLIRRLLQLNRAVCVIKSKEELDEETVKLLARGGTKCLHFRWKSSNSPFSLSQSLAQSLVELSINFVPFVSFCPFTLPNLLYLNIDGWNGWPANNSTALVSAPNLRCLTWEGRVTVHTMRYLMNLIHSFNQLRVLHVPRMYYADDEPNEKVRISLPTSLEKLTFKTNKPLELVGHSSTSLKYLVSKGIASFSLVCPNLKVLISRSVKLDSLPQLMYSLSQCEKLAKVVLVFSRTQESVSLQPLIDLLSTITGLTHLKLSAEYHSPTDSIRFEQQKFPSLGFLSLKLPKAKIIFHLDNSFPFTKFNISPSKDGDSLAANGLNKNYFVDGRFIDILSNEELHEMTNLTLD